MAAWMLPAAGAALGFLAGSQKQGQSQSMQLAPPSASEIAGEQAVTSNLPILQQLINAGAGQQDVTAGLGAQRGLGDLLAQYAQGGFLPSQQDFATAQGFASSAFAPQQTAIDQQFQQEQQRVAQLSAQLGRPVNDPILQAKLSQERMQAQERLGSQQTAFVSDFARNLPMQRLQFTGQLADVRSQLASQAMANRQALIGLGSQLQAQGQQFRAGTAQRTVESGGGLLGGITGALGGAAGFMQLGKLFNSEAPAPETSSTGGTGYLGGNYSFGGAPAPSPASSFFSGVGSIAAPVRAATQAFNSPVPTAPAYLQRTGPAYQPGLDMSFGIPQFGR